MSESSIRITSLTGSSATEIGGETAAREFGLRKRSDKVSADEINAFKDTRLCIVDEISFADFKCDLVKLSHMLQSLTECRTHIYGKIPIVFLGDFCQLEPVRGDAIYKHPKSIYWEYALTHMIELEGLHRFADCPIMQELTALMREGRDIERIRYLLHKRLGLKLPTNEELRYATFDNVNRSTLNATDFLQFLQKYHPKEDCPNPSVIPQSAILIKSSASWYNSGRSLSQNDLHVLYEHCNEGNVKELNGRARADPLFCLYSKCLVMCTENKDVKNGIANGTAARFEKVVLKAGSSLQSSTFCGYKVNSVDIDEVDHIVCSWEEGCRFQGTFKVFPTVSKFVVDFPVHYNSGKNDTAKMTISLKHFPLVRNSATTGHKLQGRSMDRLVICQWKNISNWPYVVVSRVRRYAGLFLTKPLPDNISFGPPTLLLEMMDRLRKTILVQPNKV